MPPRMGYKTVRAARGAVLALGLSVAPLACAPIALFDGEVAGMPRQGSLSTSGSFAKLPLEKDRQRDVVVLKNGDFLSGDVVAIEEETVHFAADMVDGALKIPFGSLGRVEFKKRPPGLPQGNDEIALIEGSRFRASVVKMDGKNLFFRTIVSDDSPNRVLEMNKVTSIALHYEPLVLLQEEFAQNDNVPFVRETGEWLVHKGQLLQIDQDEYNARAWARVRQSGRMRYVWTLDISKGENAGVYFLASDRGASREGVSCRVQFEYSQLAVYRTSGRGEVPVLTCPAVSGGKTKATFQVEYDCETGQMRIWLDGQQVANLRDKSPIRAGEYVILQAMRRAAFQDVAIENLDGAPMLSESERAKDVVVLRNGDTIAGEVRQISDREVVVAGEKGETTVGRWKVSRTVFGGRSRLAARGTGVLFRDGGRLTGSVRSLAGNILVVENGSTGRLPFDVSDVRTILFEE